MRGVGGARSSTDIDRKERLGATHAGQRSIRRLGIYGGVNLLREFTPELMQLGRKFHVRRGGAQEARLLPAAHYHRSVVGLADAAGVVLAGGRSSRMGRPKAALEWHGSTLLHRTTALLARTVGGPVLVVAAPDQDLPELPPRIEVVADPVEGLGPMRGLATGLAALGERSPAAFVCSTDLPFLHPALIRRVLRGFADPEGDTVDVVLPVARGYRQPLAAGYRTALAGLVERLLGEGDLRPGMLFRHCRVAQLDEGALLTDDLARHDPGLDSLVNVNEPDDYAAALARPEPEVVVERFGALASGGRRGPCVVRASSLGAAAAAVGMTLDRHVVAGIDRAPWLHHAARQLPSDAAASHVVFAQIRDVADAAFDLLQGRLCHPRHRLCALSRPAGVAWLHPAGTRQCRAALQPGAPARLPRCADRHQQLMLSWASRTPA